VSTGLIRARGEYNTEVVRRLVRRKRMRLLECYYLGLAKEPALSGAVLVGVSISSRGRVDKLRIRATSLGEPGVEHCIASVLKETEFPRPGNAAAVEVWIPLFMKPVDEDARDAEGRSLRLETSRYMRTYHWPKPR